MTEPIDPQTLREAMDVVLTWGPERMRPELDRLRDRVAHLDVETAVEALAVAHRVLGRAEGLAPAMKGVGEVDDSRVQIRSDHPWLSDDLLDRAIQQGMYSDWRDNGR